MKKNTIAELRSKSKEELLKELGEEKDKVARLFMERNIQKLKNVSLLRDKKGDIARILTIIHEKELTKI